MLIARKMNCQSHAVNWWREKASLQNGKFQTVKIYHQNSAKQRNRWLRIVWQSTEQDWRNLRGPNEDLFIKFLTKFRYGQFICTQAYTIRELSPFAWFMSFLYRFIQFFLMWPLERAKPDNLFFLQILEITYDLHSDKGYIISWRINDELHHRNW